MRSTAALAGAVIGLAAAAAAPAHATWSIVAVDPEAEEVGAGIASCFDLDASFFDKDGVILALALVPGIGAGVSQALFNPNAPPRIIADLNAGKSAADTIADLTGTFDPDAATRQHAVIRLDEPTAPASFTGEETVSWAGSRSADGVSVQGNTLVSEKVVADALAGFAHSGSRPLAERLARGLLAGSRAGGDTRCGEQTALFAQVAAVGPDGGYDVHTVQASRGDGRNPVELLSAPLVTGSTDSSSGRTAWWGIGAAALAGIALVGWFVVHKRGRRQSGP